MGAAQIFRLNAFFCLVIVILTTYRRHRYRRTLEGQPAMEISLPLGAVPPATTRSDIVIGAADPGRTKPDAAFPARPCASGKLAERPVPFNDNSGHAQVPVGDGKAQ